MFQRSIPRYAAIACVLIAATTVVCGDAVWLVPAALSNARGGKVDVAMQTWETNAKSFTPRPWKTS